jgi:hypothetical protein
MFTMSHKTMASFTIEACSFGSLVINGRSYNSDLIIYPDGRIEEPWYRSRGHRLSSQDITELIESAPEVIIAGTGMSGGVQPEKELEDLLSIRGIQFIPAPNDEARRHYNTLVKEKRVGACFHLTC